MKKLWGSLFIFLLAFVLVFWAAGRASAFQVSNGHIADDSGKWVQLNAANWFGFDNTNHAPGGLWARKWGDMLTQMKVNGINAVRLPVCPATIHGTSVSGVSYSLNPDLQGLNSLQLLDKFMAAFDAAGFYVLLDFHETTCTNTLDTLWYTSSYSEQAWISDLVSLANRYKGNPHVLGWDIKNEPHGNATWGTGNASTDWNKAAERAASALLSAAPNWLVFVEGIQDNPNHQCQSTNAHFWGENLEPFNCTPLAIPKDRLVLSPHVYGPSITVQPYFTASNFPSNMPGIYDTIFGFLTTKGYAVVPTEFGGRYHEGVTGEDAFEDNFVAYMSGKGTTNVFYWAWNGNGWPNGGLLQTDWTTVNSAKIGLVQKLWAAAPATPALPPAGSGIPSPVPSSTTIQIAVSALSIPPGAHATATWKTNATSCQTAGTAWKAGQAEPANGSAQTYSFAQGGWTAYVGLTCTGPGGTATVTVPLVVTP